MTAQKRKINRVRLSPSGIYRIYHAASKKSYVGSAVNIPSRLRSHFKALNAGTHYNAKLQNAYNTYGGAAFRTETLELCSSDELYTREQHWIDALQAVEKGYNICKVAGAPSWLGKKRGPFSPEWRAKLSEVAKRPRPQGSVSIKKSWENRKTPRVMLECADCSKTKQILETARSQYKDPYRCKQCCDNAMRAGLLTTQTLAQFTCPDCGLVRDRKPSRSARRKGFMVRCLSCARKGDLNAGSKRRQELLAVNINALLSFSL